MNSEQFHIPSPLQKVALKELEAKNIDLYIKRDDMIHPDVSGNKWRKLKFNIQQARFKGRNKIITFGGAHSNHIAATAKAAEIYGLESIGIIRGEDADFNNKTLSFARSCGMKLIAVSRSEYRNSDTWDYKESLKQKFGNFYLIPQGGANFYGVNGCIEIMSEIEGELNPDALFVPCGTATTLSGMILGNKNQRKIFGVSALKGGDFLMDDVRKNLMSVYSDKETVNYSLRNVSLLTDYHFGGFAKVNRELIAFIRNFYEQTGIKLDPIYTSKTVFAMLEKVRAKHNKMPEKWVLIHTGGLQGIAAMEEKIGEKIY